MNINITLDIFGTLDNDFRENSRTISKLTILKITTKYIFYVKILPRYLLSNNLLKTINRNKIDQ